jgi:hypothetical protein
MGMAIMAWGGGGNPWAWPCRHGGGEGSTGIGACVVGGANIGGQ